MPWDKLLFVREDVVEAAWSIVDPVLNNVVRLDTRNAGTQRPEGPNCLAADVGGWRNPFSLVSYLAQTHNSGSVILYSPECVDGAADADS
jgi:hypothetical protein